MVKVREIHGHFIRELGLRNITDAVINDLEQMGFTLVWKESTIEVWVEDAALAA